MADAKDIGREEIRLIVMSYGLKILTCLLVFGLFNYHYFSIVVPAGRTYMMRLLHFPALAAFCKCNVCRCKRAGTFCLALG